MIFNAPVISAKTENGVAILGFANDEVNTTQYLLLQRLLNPSQQDRALGLDRIHVQLNERSEYGAVKEACLRVQSVVFQFDEATAAAVSNGEPVEITFNVNSAQLDSLATQLRQLIGKDNVTFSYNQSK